MMEYLRRKRLEAAAEIELAKNKLSCIDQEDHDAYDKWTAELVIAMRKHRSIIVMAKRQAREDKLAARIRAAESEPEHQETEQLQTQDPAKRRGVLQPA